MSADATRQARAERLWTRRGGSPHRRFLTWLARTLPWAWRVRLDLIVLLNLGLGLLYIALANVAAPAVIDRTSGFRPDLASQLLFTITALAAIGCTVYWAFEATKSARLREQARYGDQPGLLLTTFAFLSFAFWTVASNIGPYAGLRRHPVHGEPIEQTISERLNGRAASANWSPAVFVGWSAQPRPSELVCASPRSSDAADVRDRNEYLCGLAARSRRADLWKAITAGHARNPDWRRDVAYRIRHNREDWTEQSGATPDLFLARWFGRLVAFSGSDEIIRYLSETDAWSSRVSSMRPWESPEDLLDDPAYRAPLSEQANFNRFVQREVLFGMHGSLPRSLFAPEDSRILWQDRARRELMHSPQFLHELAEVERSFANDIARPTYLSAAAWERLRRTRARMFFWAIELQDAAQRVDQGDAWLAEWRASERNPQARTAFARHDYYGTWKVVFLHALVEAGMLDHEIRRMKPYEPVASYWRTVLAQPPLGPEHALKEDLPGGVELIALLIVGAAAALALLVVCLARVGVGATVGGLAIALGAALLISIVDLPVRSDSRILAYKIIAGALILAPLVPVVMALVRGVRGRLTNAFAVLSIGSAAIWLPVGIVLWMFEAKPRWMWFWPDDTANAATGFAVIVLTPIAYVCFVWALQARAALLPREA